MLITITAAEMLVNNACTYMHVTRAAAPTSTRVVTELALRTRGEKH